MLELLYWVLVGGLAGWLASLVTRTGERMGCLLNIGAGVVGAVIGGWLFQQLDVTVPFSGFLASIFVAFIGATVLLLGLRLISGR